MTGALVPIGARWIAGRLALRTIGTVICPHCQIGTKPELREATLGHDRRDKVELAVGNCSECDGLIVLAKRWVTAGGFPHAEPFVLYPSRVPGRVVPDQVTGEYAQDFREACLVLADSPKASAALSRRLLQHIIREKAGIKRRNLDEEIQALIDSNTLPGDLADDLDMVRTLGNFAAHPIKSSETGAIVDVEAGEAEGLST